VKTTHQSCESIGAKGCQAQSGRREALAMQRTTKDRGLAVLMQAAQDGDRVAYASLLHELVPLLQRIVGRRLYFLQTADREDLIQEILLSLHAARATYDARRAFIPWLHAIARHRMIDRARRYGRLSANEALVDEFDDVELNIAVDPPGDAYRDPGALRAAVESLPDGQRRAIELLKFRELSLKEAASVSGASISALKVSAHRAIKSLRNSLT
jgi:RNA polymerase sigma factor (sigma-70 family)